MLLILILMVASMGFLISAYAYYIERKMKADKYYKPVCDLSDKVSCSKPILSPYGSLLGTSNALSGIFFYLLVIIGALAQAKLALLMLAILACIVSIYFAWLLYFKIHTLCLLCLSIYLINIALLVLSYLNYVRV